MQGTLTSQMRAVDPYQPTQADHERRRRMQEAWASYRGEFKQPLKIAANQPNDNVITNRCAPIVNKGVSFLFGSPLKVTTQDVAQQRYLDRAWGDDDDRMSTLAQLSTEWWHHGRASCGSSHLSDQCATPGS